MRKKVLAEIISFLFHPVLFVLFIPFLVVYKYTASGIYALKWQVFSSTFLLLGIILFILGRIKGVFQDIDLSKKEDRTKFFILVLVLSLFYILLSIYLSGVFSPLPVIVIGLCFGVLAFYIMNFLMKPSMHMAVACAYVITVGLLYGWLPLILAICILPVVAWARIVLGKHTLQEILAGGLIGVITTLATFLIGKSLLY